ncbi:DUF2634 domain-containing protein [Desulfosporosinus sp. Sb-LF]|uniref:DUF2634 domain-containing protein n=1 Tax=Desulfosporosinus sp. Sb-LF TaxID=2560027 RepID=UPI00107F4F96|nr:DUF2634 domain-containing protein [Desulfosporosinus sp. Sb-LF]TGE33318.1 DUF2634 domain-containing protein [Desulfosporosinus sp. Sb-LF]
MSIFPTEVLSDLIQTTVVDSAAPAPAKEFAWDFVANDFIFVDGKNITVTGKDAVKIWIWKALQTAKNRYRAYTSSFGNDLETLISQGLSKAALGSELERYIKESLQISPYITGIADVSSTIEGSQAQITFTAQTIYGEVVISV